MLSLVHGDDVRVNDRGLGGDGDRGRVRGHDCVHDHGHYILLHLNGNVHLQSVKFSSK